MKQKPQSTKPNLYLVGFMGVGKSAIGRKVAKELGFDFIDSDQEIEARLGKKIPEIFESEGEARFRQYEREFIESGHPTANCVISCGGGLVVQPGMKDLLGRRVLSFACLHRLRAFSSARVATVIARCCRWTIRRNVFARF